MNSLSRLGAAASVATLLASPAVHAQERLNQAGRFTVGAERLFGVDYETMTAEQNGAKTTVSQTNVTLLSRATATPVTVPRIAFDYFVIDGLSLGLGLGYSTASIDTKLEGNLPAGVNLGVQGSRGEHAFVVAPRIGYAYMFNEHVGLWPRAGVTYTWEKADSDAANSGSTSLDSLALSVEVPLVIAPVPHVAFLLAPTLDYGVAGGLTLSTPNTPDQNIDLHPLDVGLHAGLAVWF